MTPRIHEHSTSMISGLLRIFCLFFRSVLRYPGYVQVIYDATTSLLFLYRSLSCATWDPSAVCGKLHTLQQVFNHTHFRSLTSAEQTSVHRSSSSGACYVRGAMNFSEVPHSRRSICFTHLKPCDETETKAQPDDRRQMTAVCDGPISKQQFQQQTAVSC